MLTFSIEVWASSTTCRGASRNLTFVPLETSNNGGNVTEDLISKTKLRPTVSLYTVKHAFTPNIPSEAVRATKASAKIVDKNDTNITHGNRNKIIGQFLESFGSDVPGMSGDVENSDQVKSSKSKSHRRDIRMRWNHLFVKKDNQVLNIIAKRRTHNIIKGKKKLYLFIVSKVFFLLWFMIIEI